MNFTFFILCCIIRTQEGGSKLKTFEYYYDYTPEAYNYIMTSKILRNRDKKILKDLVRGKTVKELAIDNNCSIRTICTRRKEIFEKTKLYM